MRFHPSIFFITLLSMALNSKAKEILNENWRDGFTIPTAKLYPFQWLWDSGFVAMGSGHMDLNKSMLEISNMFSGQWDNGFLPHIVFHSETETTYFPNWDFWDSNVNTGSPNKPKTSGITQPPVFGFVLKKLWDQHRGNDSLKSFIKEIFPKIVSHHRFLYQYRDRDGEGLFYIFHPWESGRDNSPIWDRAMNSIVINKGDIPAYTRRDTMLADVSERPTQDKYDRYVYLMQLGKKYKYDGKAIADESPFLIQDTMMNAILIRSNGELIELAKELNIDAGELIEWQALSRKNFNAKFWNEELGIYVCYDQRAEKQINHREVGGLVPLFSKSANENQALRIAAYLQNIHNKGFYLCPSFDPQDQLFDSKRYWRGPVWPHMNWMIFEGLKEYGYNDLANIVKNDLLELIEKLGFYEYFESNKNRASQLNKGYGGGNFSWTASTYLMLCNSK